LLTEWAGQVSWVVRRRGGPCVIASVADLVNLLKRPFRRWLDGPAPDSAGRDRDEARLSAEFLAAHKARLDAIGPWSVTAGADDLDIDWNSPAALAGQWAPFHLRFHTDGVSWSFDPDERMFGLWELYLSRRDEFATQLRGLADGTPPGVGPVEEARVIVSRSEYEAGHCTYSLHVELRFAWDMEHLNWSDYNEEEGRFMGLEC
jgi:hypothetical protein